MKLSQPNVDVFIPSNEPLEHALARTTLLGVGAHQDDLETMAYYPILQGFREPAEAFTGVTVTDGAGSARVAAYKNHSDAEMAEVRRQEQRKAAVVGGYALQIQLGHPSANVKDPDAATVIGDLERILRLTKPREVYTHNLADKHDTHVAVALRLVAAIRRLPLEQRPLRLVGCEAWRDLDWMADEDKVVMDVDGNESVADALLGVFDSQINGGKRYDLATRGRRQAHATYAQSHAADQSHALIYGMDLTPLIRDDRMEPQALFERYLGAFRADVSARLSKLGGR